MSETLTFANYSPDAHGLDAIYDIGAKGKRPGVVVEMAEAFGHDLSAHPDAENLGALIGKVGSVKLLQDNIPTVQAALGTDANAVGIAQDWVERSGLLVPVDRMFKTGEPQTGGARIAVMTDGVMNWMNRRVVRALELHAKGGVDKLVMVGGTLAVKSAGTEMTAAEYQETVLKPRVEAWGVPVITVPIESGVGEDLAAAAAEKIAELSDGKIPKVTVVGNAANWPQNGGTILRALVSRGLAEDVRVVSDSMPQGDTSQPPAECQNPFTALGQLARNAQELTRHRQ